jgi:ribonuclease VapC
LFSAWQVCTDPAAWRLLQKPLYSAWPQDERGKKRLAGAAIADPANAGKRWLLFDGGGVLGSYPNGVRLYRLQQEQGVCSLSAIPPGKLWTTDSSAIVAVLLLEDEAAAFSRQIERADQLAISAATMLEISIVMFRRTRDPLVFRDIDRVIVESSMSVESMTATDADVAREAFARYGKGRHSAALNFGDCVTYALARRLSRPILCKGDDFALTDAKVVPLA